jgi:hypothetical protein
VARMRMDSDSENVWARGFPNSTRPAPTEVARD